jgi:hypothetical protein
LDTEVQTEVVGVDIFESLMAEDVKLRDEVVFVYACVGVIRTLVAAVSGNLKRLVAY